MEKKNCMKLKKQSLIIKKTSINDDDDSQFQLRMAFAGVRRI